MFEQDVRLGPGTGTFTSHSWEILIMLLGAFLLGLMLGYILWSRYKQEAEKLRLDHVSLSATAEALRKELAESKLKLATVEEEANNFASQLTSVNRNNLNLRERLNELEEDMDETLARNRQVETELGLSLSAPSAIMDIPLEVELPAVASDLPHEDTGVGNTFEEVPVPQYEIVLPLAEEPAAVSDTAEPVALDHDDSTNTNVVADASPAADVVIQPVITPSPVIIVEDKIEIADESDTIIAPVKKRKGGKTKSDDDAAILGAVHDDDLTVVEGIGPKIQMLLNQYGIRSYRQLAETDVARLKEILNAAGPQLAMHDPGTWPSQANLAANDQWEALKSIQGFLKGGKTPD